MALVTQVLVTGLLYMFIASFGKSPLGIAYGIGFTELVLAPGTPSSTARTGGIIYPVVESIARSFDSLPYSASRHRIGTYLILCLFNFSCRDFGDVFDRNGRKSFCRKPCKVS